MQIRVPLFELCGEKQMINAIDHVVILVSDLDVASADYAALGFTVMPGGEHADGATHNALVIFPDDTYLELIAFRRPSLGHRWWGRVAEGEGLVDFALLPGAIADDIAAARDRGLAIAGPTDGGRLRPDGQQVAWQLGIPPTPDLPFLCGDVTPRALRVPGGDVRRHANAAIGIATLTIAVADLAASAARYRALLGRDAERPPEGAEVPGAQVASFALGSATIVLAAPDGDADSDLRRYLDRRGEGPYALALRAAGAQPTTLDRERTHGVRLELIAS
jgi:catechol 2,3-dioxygenase-like lactoylglutathione lyase family enzyme